MLQNFRASINTQNVTRLLNQELPVRLQRALKRGAGSAAIRIQDMMRDELDRLIYSQPEGDYKRTYALMRSTYASRPGADHSGDHDAAVAGQDLAINADYLGGGGGFVRMTQYEAESDIGAYVNYASFVHEGQGPGRRVPKPFTVRPLREAPGILREEIGQALAAEHRGI